MTSVVDTSVKHFTSAMVNAPVLTGQVGSLIAILDACLKDGFDLKTATSLVVAGGVATLSFSGLHSALKDSVILVSGSSITALNGEQKVTAVGPGAVSFATAASNGTATGTITFKMAPLGWSKAFTGTNTAAYKSLAPESSGFYVRVDDTNAKYARVIGYESMSDVDTGIAPFPTNSQVSGGGYWGKSLLANTNPVKWAIVGDGQVFYVHLAAFTGNGLVVYDSHVTGPIYGFGDLVPLRPAGDLYSCALASGGVNWENQPHYSNFAYYDQPFYVARHYSGVGGSQPVISQPYMGIDTQGVSGINDSFGRFPSSVDGSMILSPRYIRSSDPTQKEPRCDIPGLFTVPHNYVYGLLKHFDVIEGAGALAGRKLLGLGMSTAFGANPATANAIGLAYLDITGPWR